MITRIDRLGVALPPPSGPDPAGAAAVFNGPHPETGEDLIVEDGPPEGALPHDLPPQTDVFAPDYEPHDIAEIAKKLRKAAGFKKQTGGVA